MSLFKIFKGSSSDLVSSNSAVKKAYDGYAYFTPDDGKFYIDVTNNNGEDAVIGTNRIPLNAAQADKVNGLQLLDQSFAYKIKLSIKVECAQAVVNTGLTEEQIFALPGRLYGKLYLASDTNKYYRCKNTSEAASSSKWRNDTSAVATSMSQSNQLTTEDAIYIRIDTKTKYYNALPKFFVTAAYDNINGSSTITGFCRKQNQFEFTTCSYNGNNLVGIWQFDGNTDRYILKFTKYRSTYGAISNYSAAITVYSNFGADNSTIEFIDKTHPDYAAISHYSYVSVPEYGIAGTNIYHTLLPQITNTYTLGNANNKWSRVYATMFNGQGGEITNLNASNISTGTLAKERLPTVSRTNNTNSASPTHGASFTAIDSITTDTYGRVTAINTKTINLPTETDPTVPAWAKENTKPRYSLNEINNTTNIQAIEALTGTSGLLKKTANGTWELDTNTYALASAIPTNYMTTNTAQTITGSKTWGTNSTAANVRIENGSLIIGGLSGSISTTTANISFMAPNSTTVVHRIIANTTGIIFSAAGNNYGFYSTGFTPTASNELDLGRSTGTAGRWNNIHMAGSIIKYNGTTGYSQALQNKAGTIALLSDIPTKSSWNYDNVYVKYAVAQSLTDEQKTQARSNIGAGTSSLALGTTSSTAYRGDYGAAAYTHAVTNKGAAFASGLYKITTNSEGHVTAATAVVKADITGLGIPPQDTTYVFDGTYNASTNKAATVATVTNAIAALNYTPVEIERYI